jgi:hypothetical protein
MKTKFEGRRSKVNPWLVAGIVLVALLLAAAVLLAALQPDDYRLENLIEKAQPCVKCLKATATWSK